MGANILILVAAAALCLIGVEGFGSIVGGRTEVADVKTNKEVQDLGRFSVEEYNRGNRGGLKFSEVVAAEKQVVSGIKYYLKVEAIMKNGEKHLFDSVVIVKPGVSSKALLHFGPSTQ